MSQSLEETTHSTRNIAVCGNLCCSGGNGAAEDRIVSLEMESTLKSNVMERNMRMGQLRTFQDDVVSSYNTRTYQGVRVSFLDVCVTVGRTKRLRKKILTDVCGYLDPGSLTSLMGASGSGKTTLVDVLTRRKNSGSVTGEVLFDGQRPSSEFLKNKVSYLQQDDALIENLTVQEMLYYSHDLVAGRPSRKEVIRNTIDSVIQQMSLESAKDTIIGGPLRKGISGGQRKRVGIAVSILGQPSLLVLDEPTSGLDSYTSFGVLSAIKGLSKRGLTTITTIHAPSASIFALFDKLLMLLDGQVVYFGNVAGEHVEYFSEYLGFYRSDCVNDADWLTSIVVEASRLKGIEGLVMSYLSSDLREKNMMHIQKVAGEQQSDIHHDVYFRYMTKESWYKKLGLWPAYCLIKHRLLPDYREPFFLLPRIGEKICFAFVILTLYLNQGRNVSTNASENLSIILNLSTCLFMWGILPAFGSLAAIPALFSERALYARENNAGYYQSGAFLFARMFEEALVIIIASAVTACAVWFAVGLSGSWSIFWVTYVVTSLSGTLLAYFFVTCSPTAEIAIILDAGFNIILLFFTGFLIRMVDTPNYWKWLIYINYLHYSWGALMKNHFTDGERISEMDTVLKYYDFDNGASAWDYVGYCIIFTAVYFLFGLLSLRFITHIYIKR